MRFLLPAVAETAAWNALYRVRFQRTRRAVRKCLSLVGASAPPGPPAAPRRNRGSVPFLELIWLPCYVVVFEAVVKGQVRGASVLVGGHEPMSSVMDLAAASWETRDVSESFPASVSEEDAARIARRAVFELRLRSRGWGREPNISERSGIELIQYPYWVYYFARHRAILDVKILDAMTGRPAGAKAKLALLGALAAAHKPDR